MPRQTGLARRGRVRQDHEFAFWVEATRRDAALWEVRQELHRSLTLTLITAVARSAMSQTTVVRLRNRYLFLLDAVLVGFAPIVAYAIRFEGWRWPAEHQRAALYYVALALPLKLTVFGLLGLYRRLLEGGTVGEGVHAAALMPWL